MEDLKMLFAKKLIQLRTEARMTQTELGAKLNYTDKAISKWERGEALPDASVLKKISKLFGVSIDYMLGDAPEDAPRTRPPLHPQSDWRSIMWLTLAGIWTLAVLIFVILWLLDFGVYWLVFVYAIPVSLVSCLVLNSVWNRGKGNFIIVSLLTMSVLVVAYLILLSIKPWQLFLLAVPAEAVVYFSFRIRKPQKP